MLNVKPGGKLIIGNVRDAKGKRKRNIFFSGKILDFLVLKNKNLSFNVTKYVSCKKETIYNDRTIIRFQGESTNIWLKFHVYGITENIKRTCLNEKNVSPGVNKKYKSSEKLCKLLKGNLLDENNFRENSLESKNYCQNNNNFLWIKSIDTYNISNDNISANKEQFFYENNETLIKMCPYVNLKDSDLKVNTKWALCSSSFCTYCKIKDTQKYSLRGLCKISAFDTEYFASGYINNKLQFVGKTNSRIYCSTDKKWKIEVLNQNITAVLKSNDGLQSEYPFGTNTWNIYNDGCELFNGAKLLFSGCGENEFPCLNGQCIDMEYRCDVISHCQDSSDELNCQKLQLTERTNRNLIPPSFNEEDPLIVHMRFYITSITKIDVIDGNIDFNFMLKSFWSDSTVKFYNLKENKLLNKISLKNIWNPKILLFGTNFSRISFKNEIISTYVDKFSKERKFKMDGIFKGMY